MRADRHPSATTTHSIRRTIQNSRDTATALALRFGINRKTVQKWRHRSGVEDGQRGRPKEHSSTVLTQEEEAIVIGFRKLSLLPLDDCLYALRGRIPHLTRSSLHRCLQRYGLSQLQTNESPALIGYFQIDIGETITGEGCRFVFVATDLVCRLFYAEQSAAADETDVASFLEHLVEVIPYRLHTVLTANELPFAHPRRRHGTPFNQVCADNSIEHHLTNPDPRWAAVQIKRISGGVEPYATNYHLDEDLRRFMLEYNVGKRLKILKGQTPHQYVCKLWAAHPESFKRSPTLLQPGYARRDCLAPHT